jgi:TRAP-type C4-dicarboxylate transport system permease small subunit
MNKFSGMVTGLSRILDKIAGFCMVAIMTLVVANVLLRTLFNRPILGTIDYVVILTAVMIGLALAYCAIHKGHIAVSFIVDRMSLKMQAVVGIVVDIISFSFWGLCAWQIGVFAQRTAATGEVAPTTQIPLYPFIYLVAFGLLALCLVLLASTVESFQKALLPSSSSFAVPDVITGNDTEVRRQYVK